MDENTLTNPTKWGALIGLGDLPENPSGPIERKGCCAALYDTQAVRMLLGDSLHPGGLALTNRLGKLVNIKADDMVLDLACGSGASAMAIARAFHCRVVGVDLGAQSIAEAASTARNSRDGKRVVGFLRGDGEQLPLVGESFDAVLSECSMSLFPDKKRGVAEVSRLLRPGGRLGVSDVTVEPGTLPEELNGILGQILCVADAPPVEGYRKLFNADGLSLIHEQDSSDSILKLLGEIEGKVAAIRMLLSFQGDSDGTAALLLQGLELLEKVKALVNEGRIGYRLFVAEKSSN